MVPLRRPAGLPANHRGALGGTWLTILWLGGGAGQPPHEMSEQLGLPQYCQLTLLSSLGISSLPGPANSEQNHQKNNSLQWESQRTEPSPRKCNGSRVLEGKVDHWSEEWVG